MCLRLLISGIFRISAGAEERLRVQYQIERGTLLIFVYAYCCAALVENYSLAGEKSPHVPAALLKQWLRHMTEPVIPFDLYVQVMHVSISVILLPTLFIVA